MSTNILGIEAEVNLTINWYELGESLGEEMSTDQASLLGGLAATLHKHRAHTQAHYIGDDLALLEPEDQDAVVIMLRNILDAYESL